MRNVRGMLWWCAALATLMPAVSAADIAGTKAAGIEGMEICIVDNSYTGTDFRDAYERQVRAKDYATRIVPDKTACPIVTTYVATYGSTGWGRYMKTAMLSVLRDGEEIGVVRYSVARGKPFKGKVEAVIGEMVAALYP